MSQKEFKVIVVINDKEQMCIVTDPECVGGKTGKIIKNRFIVNGILYELESMFLLKKVMEIDK